MVTTPALTSLTEDETLFRDSVYEFADRDVRPLVRQMDDDAKIPRALIDRLFELGVMGIEIPDEFGGSGATFFHSILAIEALSRVGLRERAAHTSRVDRLSRDAEDLRDLIRRQKLLHGS